MVTPDWLREDIVGRYQTWRGRRVDVCFAGILRRSELRRNASGIEDKIPDRRRRRKGIGGLNQACRESVLKHNC